MAKKVCKQEEEAFRNQLAAAVRSIQWSYAVFWCRSPKDQGVLQWGEGYYNGDIKTRRTVLNMDLKVDQTSCQRSDQLRELYESLLSSTTNSNTKQARRPLAALSPEDLTNVEWYYMVCMSFVFNVGQGLPGKCLANGRPIWLSSAHCADTGLFCRSLLAKSAGIKTVVCFPFAGGVIELGVTEIVKEDHDFILHVRTTFLEDSAQFVSWELDSMPKLICGDDIHAAVHPPLQGQDVEAMSSPSGSSNGHEPNQAAIDNMFLFEGLSCEAASPANLIMEDELSNCLYNSRTSSECISQSIVIPDNVPSSPRNEASNHPNFQEKGLGNSHEMNPSSQDLHYRNVLSSLLNESSQLVVGLPSRTLMDKKSSFGSWNSEDAKRVMLSRAVSPQSMLKKALFKVPMMHRASAIEHKENGGRKDVICKQEALEVASTNHVLAERRRREKVNERFSTLSSLIPSLTKVDKVSILDDTIAYLKELERRVEELESCQDQLGGNDTKKKRRALDVEERTSDNYGIDINVGAKNKRKAGVLSEEQAVECDHGQQVATIDNTITISMVEKDITINVNCPWRESLLLEMIDAISSLNIDSQSVQSSTVEGILSLSMKSRLKGCNSLSIGIITQALQRVIRKG